MVTKPNHIARYLLKSIDKLETTSKLLTKNLLNKIIYYYNVITKL